MHSSPASQRGLPQANVRGSQEEAEAFELKTQSLLEHAPLAGMHSSPASQQGQQQAYVSGSQGEAETQHREHGAAEAGICGFDLTF